MTAATRQILNRAADLVEQGWTQGHYYESRDGQDCYCAIGAINASGFNERSRMKAEGLDCTQVEEGTAGATLFVKIRVQYEGFASIAMYNDSEGRTQAEVVALLRSVANQ